jgi:hypothetical protein
MHTHTGTQARASLAEQDAAESEQPSATEKPSVVTTASKVSKGKAEREEYNPSGRAANLERPASRYTSELCVCVCVYTCVCVCVCVRVCVRVYSS